MDRAEELERLCELVERVASGRGGAGVIEAEPGLGKTALLGAVIASARDRELRVLHSQAEELEQRLPFGAIATALGLGLGSPDPRLAEIERLLRGGPGNRHSGTTDAQYGLVEAVLDLVDDWCAEGPLVLAVDDLQWADRLSLLILHRLGRLVEQLPLLLLGACRTVPRSPDLDQFRRGMQAHSATWLRLPPLGEPATIELIARLVGHPPGPELAGLVARTAGGNPLYITELVDALARDGRIEPRQGQVEATVTEVPPSLGEAILHRLSFLPRPTFDVLRMASLLGSTFDSADLATVLDRPPTTLVEPLQEAIAAGVLTTSGKHLVFRHDLIRHALYDDVPASLRAALHMQAGQALAGSGAPVERVAEHLLQGTASPGEAIVGWLETEGDRLIARAPALAVELLRRVLNLFGAGEERAAALRVKLCTALLSSGQLKAAEQEARDTLPTVTDPRLEAELRWVLVRAAFEGGSPEALHEVELALASGRLGPVEAARLQAYGAITMYTVGRTEDAEAMAYRAQETARAYGDEPGIPETLLSVGTIRYLAGHYDEAIELLAECRRRASPEHTEPEQLLMLHIVLGFALRDSDRLAEADEAFEAGMRIAPGIGGTYLSNYHVGKAVARYLLGGWDDAVAELEAARQTLDLFGVTRAGINGLQALIAVHRGDLAMLSRCLREAEAAPLTGTGGRLYEYWLVWARGLALEAEGHPEQALDQLFDAWHQGVAGVPQARLHHVSPDVARLAAALGDRDRLRIVAEALDDHPTGQRTPSILGSGELARGLLEESPDRLLAAAGHFRRANRPLYQALAYEHAAVLLARAGDTARARDAASNALDRYTQLDAAWDLARAEARLRDAGLRHGIRAPRRRPKTGWAALTDTERKVARYVTEGLSNPAIANRMYLSRRTVQSHVSSILGKLGLSSRVELAATVSRLQAAAHD
ncbi:LuxR family transcriptional regulator [Longimycelium tulufanense]|uniref:LuxR family transcriptional regulator n=1 Tax=Longimycelium tulufanense TaxID=907463 RepID=A0A8J3FW30_9PSEU|nr:LuxR family transcriptional regulator [Longimycelium tulufanense]